MLMVARISGGAVLHRCAGHCTRPGRLAAMTGLEPARSTLTGWRTTVVLHHHGSGAVIRTPITWLTATGPARWATPEWRRDAHFSTPQVSIFILLATCPARQGQRGARTRCGRTGLELCSSAFTVAWSRASAGLVSFWETAQPRDGCLMLPSSRPGCLAYYQVNGRMAAAVTRVMDVGWGWIDQLTKEASNDDSRYRADRP
jgi:hypothetical protein